MNDTPETNEFAIKFKTTCGEKYWVPVDIARKLEQERDEAFDLLASEKITRNHIIERGIEMQKELAEAREESLEQARLLGISGERECRIIAERDEARREMLGWENKWNAAIGMAAIAENERDLLKEELIDLEDQRDLAMKVIKRLEAQLAQKEP